MYQPIRILWGGGQVVNNQIVAKQQRPHPKLFHNFSILILFAFCLLFGGKAWGQNTITISYDFEDGEMPDEFINNSSYPWTNVSNEQNNTGHFLKSGNGGVASSSSEISITIIYTGDGTISFRGGCWGEGTNYDKCIFEIDGVQQFSYGALQNWNTYTFNVTAGEHTFTWKYTKDSSVNPTGDAFYVDDIVIEMPEPLCPMPTDLAVSNITSSSAVLGWSGSADSYVVYMTNPIVAADFETGNMSQAAFSTTTSYPFSVEVIDGNYVAKSGNGGVNSSTSDMVLSVTLATDGVITFRAKISSESGYDKGYFTVDGEPMGLNGISGSGSWITYTVNLTAGTHTLRWYYSKDSSAQSNDDCLYVDDIVVLEWEQVGTTTGTSYNLSGLTSETTYQVKVVGVCDGNDGPASATLSFTTLEGSCLKPTSLTAGTPVPRSVQLSWTAGGSETAWQICINDDEANPISVTTNPYTLTGLTPETTYNVKVRANCGGEYSAWTSNSSFTTPIACPAPTSLTVSNVDTRSAQLSWTAGGSEAAWQICINGDEAHPISVSTNPYTLTGLTPETDYDVKVRAICGGGDYSTWTSNESFTTLIACPAPTGLAYSDIEPGAATISWDDATASGYNLRYGKAYTFDDGTMQGWTTIDADGDGYDWVLGSATDGIYYDGLNLAGPDYCHNSSLDMLVSGSFTNYTGTALNPNNYLVSPQITFGAGASISFWAKGQDASYAAEHFGVAVSTTGTNASDFRMVPGSEEYIATSDWVEYTVDLSGYSGQGYVAIRHYNISDMFLLLVDDISIMSGNTAIDVVPDVSSPYDLAGLEPSTTYWVQVQSDCDSEGLSSWCSPVIFTTGVPTRIKITPSAADEMTWEEFAGYVNGGHSYSGETVTLMEDISISAMVGNSSRPFKGTFEGNEHKITVSISSSEQGAAPFRYINGATIQNLEVDGTVTSTAHHASGLVGFCADGSTNTIQNCLVSTNVTNSNPYNGDSGNNYMGGLIGHNMTATTSIIGCVYNGMLTSQGFKGGMVGFGDYNSNVTITNSYFAGAYSANGYSNPNFSPIACHGSGRNFNFTFSNFYYNTDAGTFTAPTYEGTVNASYSGTGRAKHGYTITGESPVVVAVSGDDTEYDVSGITAYSTGIVYDGDVIAGAGDNVALTLSGAPAGYNYEADYGTLTGSGSSYTLAMTGNNTKIYAVTCFRPDNLEVSANNNSITITWDDNNASEWQVAVHTSDDGNPGNHIVGTVSERTYTVSSLAINQTRYLWVRAYCSASDQSVWIGPVNATTHCTEPTGLTATPFTTGAVLTWDSGTDEEYTVELGTPVFLNVTDAELINESFEGGSMPDGWTSEGDATWSVGSGDYSSSTGSYDGSYNALITHNADDYETYLVTPAIDLSGATSATLSCCYINRSWYGDIDEFGIYYRINGGSWTELFSTSEAHSSWTSTGDISLSTFGANFQLGFKMTDHYGYGVAIDKIVFSVTGNLPTGDYTWTPVTSSATMPYTLTGLTMGNTYYVRVKDQCDNISDVITFSPACTSPSDLAVEPSNRSAEVTWLGGDSYNLRYRTAFVGLPEEGFSSAPSGWFFRTGALNNDGTASLSGTSSWSRGTSNNVFDSHIYMNLYSTKNFWLITPSISIQDDCLFNFDVAYTAYSGSNATPAQNCTTHRFAVLISTDNMESWTILREWNNNGSSYSLDGISTTGDNVSISLSSYAGQTAYIAFFAHSETTSYDNNIHFDNVKIGNEPGSWMPSSSGTSASSPYTISNLSSETTYEVQVQATCEGDWNTSATFTTLPEYTVSASVTPAGAGTISGDGIYAEGATCTLIATVEDDCYTFENWTENGTPVSTNATYSFTVTEDMDLVANFTNRNYTLTIIADEGGTVTGAGDYDCFTPATLTATPDDCHIFRYWKDPNNVTYNMNPLTPLGVDHDITFIAHFELRPALTASIDNATDYCRNISATALSTSPAGGSENYSYQWQSSADNSEWSSTGTNSNECSISTASVGTTYYRVIVTDTHGCGTATAESVQITVNDKPSVSFTQPAAVCSGAVLSLSASVTDNGGLSTTDGYTISEDQSSWTEFANGSTVTDDKDNYYIKYTATNGCGDNEIIRQITVHSLPTASIEGTNPLPVCVFTQVTLNASGAGDGGSYAWDNELGSGASKTITVTEAKNYTVTVTDANTCTARDTKSVTIKIPGNTPMTHAPEHGAIWTGYEGTDWSDEGNWVYFDGHYRALEGLSDTLNLILRTGDSDKCILNNPVISSPTFASNSGMIVRRPITIGEGTELNIDGDLNVESGSITLSSTGALLVTGNANIASGASVAFDNKDTLSIAGNLVLEGTLDFPESDTTPALRLGGNLVIDGGSLDEGGTLVFAGSSTQNVSNGASPLTLNNNVRMNMHRSRAGVPHTVFPDGTIFSKTTIFEYGIMDGKVTFNATGRTIVCGGYESYASGTVTKIGAGNNFTFPTGDDNVLGSITARIAPEQNAVAKFHHKATGFTEEDGYPRWWNVADMCGTDPFNHVSNFEYWDFNSSAALSGVMFSTAAATAAEHFHDPSEYPNPDNPDNIIQVAVYDDCWRNGGGDLSITADFTEITISNVAVAARGTRGGAITTLGSKSKSVVLPIELTSFTATCDGRSTLVEWTTASERNNDYFSLERSDDAINFTEIARVAGAGNSIEPLNYSYTDYGIHGGDNYYRLVQVDYDGTRTVSDIVVANCVDAVAEDPEVLAYPNPFNGELTLVLDNFDNRAATIEVYDMLGKQVFMQKADAPQNSYETILNLSNLPSGTYTVRVSTTDFVINKNVVKN